MALKTDPRRLAAGAAVGGSLVGASAAAREIKEAHASGEKASATRVAKALLQGAALGAAAGAGLASVDLGELRTLVRDVGIGDATDAIGPRHRQEGSAAKVIGRDLAHQARSFGRFARRASEAVGIASGILGVSSPAEPQPQPADPPAARIDRELVARDLRDLIEHGELAGGAEAFLERAAEAVHDAWIERNRAWAPAEQCVPYAELPENEKEKNRVIVRRALEHFSTQPVVVGYRD
jgi:hypothetical protein